MRTGAKEQEIDAKFKDTLKVLGFMFDLPINSEREKLRILEKTENNLRTYAGSLLFRAFSVQEVCAVLL